MEFLFITDFSQLGASFLAAQGLTPGGLTHLLIRRCLKPFRGAGGPWGAQGCPSYRGGEEGWGGWAAPFQYWGFLPLFTKSPMGCLEMLT